MSLFSLPALIGTPARIDVLAVVIVNLMTTTFPTQTGQAIALLYALFFISKYQGTPGKLILGMKIVRADGSRLSTGRIIGRYFAEWINGFALGLTYIMVGVDLPEHRGLHDRICDTRVVKR